MIERITSSDSRSFERGEDLSAADYRHLVSRRAHGLLGAAVGRIESEAERKEVERSVQLRSDEAYQKPDYLPVKFLRDGVSRARSVCRIGKKGNYGTGFLIAPGAVMTAYHVVRTKWTAERSYAEFGFETDSNDNETIVKLKPQNGFICDLLLDFAIVALDDGAPEDLEPIRLLRNPSTIMRYERVNIIEHPHASPKKIAIRHNKVTRVMDRVIQYETATEQGSSGAPVFNDSWDVVALHHSGFPLPHEGIRVCKIVECLLKLEPPSPSPEREFLARILQTIPDREPKPTTTS